MALKKSELYSSLWQSCDALRGGMDASQYKDYVLVLLFLKYVSDKYAGRPYAPIQVPAGSSFRDLVALKGQSDLGDQINKTILGPLASANKLSHFPDFNDTAKLGSGKEMVDRLTDLIAIFENPALDFSKNRAEGDDILGDAYEYLMRHFATESGKSKGQFYTPAEVSRVIAKVLGIGHARTSASTTVYDPTCGSGSLLLKVAAEAGTPVTLYGQEKDAATAALARMNMILHDNPGAVILQANTLADPKFGSGDSLKLFDYVVANPPFSDKRWSTGFKPEEDRFRRFQDFGVPPAKQGDYAYLLHIVRSLKSTGKGACILPHGVLFRGNAEAEIRRALVRKGYIQGIIGLPPNLFYGTGIPACIVVLDKEDAQARKGIFMIDASAGFLKDGSKNRLREMDIHRIVDVFTKRIEVPKYARMVSFAEIEKNEFNLNLPRYIDSQTPEDRQDIEGHLRGGIPETDVDALQPYWAVCPHLRYTLFKPCRPGYLSLAVEKSAIRSVIYQHPEFTRFITDINAHFAAWRKKAAASLKALGAGFHPKGLIVELSEGLLAHYAGKPLLDPYDVYQHLMDYWAETMQDDCYLIAADGWTAKTYRIIEKDKKGKEKDKGWTCDLIPKALLVARYFAKEQAAIDQLATELEGATTRFTELEEENGGEEGVFSQFEKTNKANVLERLREIQGDKDSKDEVAVLHDWLALNNEEADLKKQLKRAEASLDAAAYAKYPKLTEPEIKTLAVDNKWLATLDGAIHREMDRLSQQLTHRVKELSERYETPLPQIGSRVTELEAKLNRHLELFTCEGRIPEFEGKSGYKQTSIGEIPEDWQLRPMLTTVRVAKGQVDPKVEPYRSMLLVAPDHIESGSGRLLKKETASDQCAISGKYTFEKGDIVYSKIRPYLRKAILADFDGLCSADMYPLKPAADVSAGFILAAILGHHFSKYAESVSTRSGMPKINRAELAEYSIALPTTKAEQEAIATVLSDMDAEIAALEAKLTKARQLKQGMMQELLTGRIRLV